MATTTANKTIKVTHIAPEQNVIRCVARFDMPEYGIKAGDVFFLSRGSEEGTFHVVTWDEIANKWRCDHPSRANAKSCIHIVNVSDHCHARATRNKPIPLAERGSLNGNRPFSLLKAS